MGRVEVVFNAVIGAAWQLLRYVRPFVAESLMKFEYFALLLLTDWVLLDVGVQVIMPSRVN